MELYIRHSADREAICEERQILTLQDQMEEFMFLGLRCTRGVKKSDFLRLFGCSIDTVYGKNISKYLQYGYCNKKEISFILQREEWMWRIRYLLIFC